MKVALALGMERDPLASLPSWQVASKLVLRDRSASSWSTKARGSYGEKIPSWYLDLIFFIIPSGRARMSSQTP